MFGWGFTFDYFGSYWVLLGLLRVNGFAWFLLVFYSFKVGLRRFYLFLIRFLPFGTPLNWVWTSLNWFFTVLLLVFIRFHWGLTGFYYINGFTWFWLDWNWFLLGFTGFYWVLLGFTGFDWVWLGLTGFDWVWLGLTGFYCVLLGLTGFDWVWLGFTGFYWVRLAKTLAMWNDEF